MRAAAAERAIYGLPTDFETVAALLGGEGDVGSRLWGIPMSLEEAAATDIDGRMAFAARMADRVLPYARSRPHFAGAFDQTHAGRLVIGFVGAHPEDEQTIRGPSGTDGSRVAFTDMSVPYLALEDAFLNLSESGRTRLPSLAGVAVDDRMNALWLEVASTDVTYVQGQATELASELGVPILVRAAEPAAEAACITRDNCISPMRAGSRVRNGSDTGPICTMAFHIRSGGGDEQFVTAGHCGHNAPSNYWYHQGLSGTGIVGGELATQYASGGIDIMRVQMPDAQASDWVIGTTYDVDNWRNPIQGETVCVSLGISNRNDCGSVTATSISWTEDACGCTIYGADADGLGTINFGDSGSPIYSNGIGIAIAIGVLSRIDGHFAKMGSGIANWSGFVVI